jgi:thiamine-monophosphate kinase
MRGFMRLARRHGVDLVGGDTTRGPLNVCVQIMGEVPRGRALRRDGARSGDDVWVSGTLGDAALALSARRLGLGRRECMLLAEKLDAPTPRIGLGEQLRGVARSAIDVSDGLVADLGHICERSKVAAAVDLARIPASATMRQNLHRPAAQSALLAGGDDYELVFTAGRARRRAVARIGRRLRLKLTRIGRILRQSRGAPRVTVLDPAGRRMVLRHGGYEHFSD